MELSACIVVYNGADEALRAAQTVLDCTRRHPLTLYLVDNASPDGSGQCLAKAAKDGTLHIRKDQKVEVLCRTENGGFGTGHNTVLSLLQSRVHFILNPDIQLTADTLSDLADRMAQHPGVVMARPALTFPDGRPQRLPLRRCSVRAMVYRQLPCLKFWAKYNERYLMADKDLTKPTEIEFCTGSFSAVDTAVFKAVGGFDEDYFMYVEDADLNWCHCISLTLLYRLDDDTFSQTYSCRYCFTFRSCYPQRKRTMEIIPAVYAYIDYAFCCKFAVNYPA